MIVVGIDGSEESANALRWAVAEARLRRTPIRAVHTWTYPLYPGGYGYVAAEVMETHSLQDAAEKLLEATLADIAGDTSDVEIERVAIQGPPAKTLIDQAEDADLLVVGSRGHGGFTGLVLGSVSAQCAHHARCPLVIVRPPHDHAA